MWGISALIQVCYLLSCGDETAILHYSARGGIVDEMATDELLDFSRLSNKVLMFALLDSFKVHPFKIRFFLVNKVKHQFLFR